MRIQDEEWLGLLSRLRVGACTRPDIDVLHSLRLDLPGNESTDFHSSGWDSAVLITPRHSARKRWNAAAI